MSMGTAKIDLNITEGMIANAIAVAIADAFTPEKRDAMIRDVIRAHLAVKQNSWDKDTLLSKAVGDQIRQMTNDAVRERVAAMRDEVFAVVNRTLGPQFQDSVLAQLQSALGRMMTSSLALTASASFDVSDAED